MYAIRSYYGLHIGEKSEVFQFGPPEMWSSSQGQLSRQEDTPQNLAGTEEEKGENLAVTIGKGVLLAPVAIVAAPFVGAAYLVNKATEATAEVGTDAATTAASDTTVVTAEGAGAEAAMTSGAAAETLAAASAEGSVEVASPSAAAAGSTTVAAEETTSTEKEEGENLAVKVGKGILMAPVAIVAAPFVGAAYLVDKATETRNNFV